MKLNNIIASPSFAAWVQGEPLDIPNAAHARRQAEAQHFLHRAPQRRRAHVLRHFPAGAGDLWMRSQPGTTSLRALVYMDEIFGYFPPTANPPSKRPMLTLLKQARAFGWAWC
jgi:hypothetical protein